MMITLIDNAATGQESCSDCGARHEWVVDVSGDKFPKEGIILCRACVVLMARDLATFVRQRRHRPTDLQKQQAAVVPQHIREIANRNDDEDGRPRYPTP